MNKERGKLLGLNFEDRLNFDFYVNTIFKKATKRYHVLPRQCNYNKVKEATNSHEYHLSLFRCPIVGLWATELIKVTKKL